MGSTGRKVVRCAVTRASSCDEAYVRLVELASAAGVTLTGMARCVLQAAVDGVPYA